MTHLLAETSLSYSAVLGLREDLVWRPCLLMDKSFANQ